MYVRTATDRDLKAIRELLVATWHATYDPIYGSDKVSAITNDWHSIASLTQRVSAPRSEFLVADDGKQIAGVAFAQADVEGDEITLRQLYVLPTFQGRGIGGMLLDEIEESFPEAKRFALEVEKTNGKAIQFYLSRGYADVGESDGPCVSTGIGKDVRRMERARSSG